jgi:type IV secretion system protein VirB8
MTAPADWRAPRIPEKDLEGYYAEVKSFQRERAEQALRSRSLAWAIAWAGLAGFLALAVALAWTLPLKQLVPVYLWVRHDGTVDNSVSVSDLPPTESQAVVVAAIWEYVHEREAYTFADAQYRYDVVSGMSSPHVRDDYQKWFSIHSLASPQVKFGRHGQVNVEKLGISFVGNQTALVRFRRVEELYGQSAVRTTWSATVGFDVVSKLSMNTRLVDPGGVRVTTYMAAEETP